MARRRIEFTAAQRRTIRDDYVAGIAGLHELADRYLCCPAVIRRILTAEGIDIRKRGRPSIAR